MAVSLFLDGQQVGKHIALFLRRADTAQHIVAIALEPFVHFFRASEPLRVGRGRKRVNDLAGLGMLAQGDWIFSMAGSAAPFSAMLCLEKTFPARDREPLETWRARRFLLNGSQYLVGGFRKSRLRRQSGNKHQTQYIGYTKHF